MNYFAVEQPTVDRLKAQVTLVDDQYVLTAPDLAGVAEGKQNTPALYLIYAGDQVPSDENARDEYGNVQVTKQQWLVNQEAPTSS